MDTIKVNYKPVKMVAHRGVSGIERENTNAAFLAAANRSYFGIETDVHRTADGQFVTIHDFDTKRVSNEAVNIEVETSDYATLKEIVLPDLDGSTHRTDIRIPLLVDYVKICKKYGKIGVLELKSTFTKEELANMVEIIRQEDYLDGIIFIAFDLDNCIGIRELLPEQTIQWLTSKEYPEEMTEVLCQYGFDLDIRWDRVNKDIVDTLHAHGLEVNVWTVDDPEMAKTMIDMGVDYITSNILE